MKKYVESLCQEIRGFFHRFTDYEITSIFLGGGTPSILDGTWIEQILQTIGEAGFLLPDAEITIEANPGTLTKEKLLSYKRAGINRLSMGLQSTIEKELQYLGRIHTYEQFLTGYHLARQCGFTNINVDLMSAIPYQTLDSWTTTLDRILALAPEHISAYSLIVEEGTPFYEDSALENLIPDEDTERRMYERTEERLKEQGYMRYEVSNYAKPGKECAHNILYWTRKDYIGFGLGASSCLSDVRFKNTDDLTLYLQNPYREPEHRDETEQLSKEEQMAEEMILRLRMTCGVSKEEFRSRYGIEVTDLYGEIIEKYKKEGLLTETKDSIAFTKKGFDLSNIVLCEFL